MKKVDKMELLRHYRIANFDSIDKLLEQIAKKKGLNKTESVEKEQRVNTLVNKKGKLKKQTDKVSMVVEKIQVPDKEQAARRLIRDYLNNRLAYFTPVE